MEFYVSKNCLVSQKVNLSPWKFCIASYRNWWNQHTVLINNVTILNNAAGKLHMVSFAITTNGQLQPFR